MEDSRRDSDCAMIRVLIVDDQPVVRNGMRMILETDAELEVVGEASNGRLAIEVAEQCAPDVVLLDLRMPEMDGISATRILIAMARPPKIVVVTAFDPDEYVFKSLSAGASGFLLKSDSPHRFIEAVKAAFLGESLFSPEVTRRLVERFVQTSSTAPAQTLVDPLTVREVEVLLKVAEGHSNREIAAELFISLGTVKTHVARILAKIGVRDRLQMVVFAYESGWVHPGVVQPDVVKP